MKAKYTDNETCQKPTEKNAKIWRYMDFAKFVSLLENEALFFCKSDRLGDEFEGSYSQVNVANRPIEWKAMSAKALQLFPIVAEELRKVVMINCWSLGEHESSALWELYVKSHEGVAIQSTFERLTQCFDLEAEHIVFVGKVSYIDYRTERMPDGNLFYPFLHKRKSFAYEQELRAVTMVVKELAGAGEYVEVKLDTLIEKVYVAPKAEDWFFNVVKSVTKRYGLEKTIIHSDLDAKPVY